MSLLNRLSKLFRSIKKTARQRSRADSLVVKNLAQEETKYLNKLEKIDQEIIEIQRSTKTLVPQMSVAHNFLRMKYRWYYDWHKRGYANKLHWMALSVIFILIAFYSFSSFFIIGGNPKAILAAYYEESTPIGSLPLQTDTSIAAKDGSAILIEQSGESEIVEKRTENFKQFRQPDGEIRVAGSVKPIHYRINPEDNDEQFKEIDLTIKSTPDKLWQYAMETNGYQARFWTSRTINGQTMPYVAQYRQEGKWLEMAPTALVYENSAGERQIISKPITVASPNIDNTNHFIEWKGVFGEGIDFRYNLGLEQFFKTVVINSKDVLPAPTISPDGLKLTVVMALSWDDRVNPDNAQIKNDPNPENINLVSTEVIDQSVTQDLADKTVENPDEFAYLDQSNQDLWFMKKPLAWDSTLEERKEYDLDWDIRRIDDFYYSNISFDYSKLDGNIFPLFIDAAITEERTTVSADDAYSYGTTWPGTTNKSTSGGSSYFGATATNFYSVGLRFQSVPIPKDAAITSSSFSVVAGANGLSNGMNVTIYGEDVDDSATWNLTTHYPGGASLSSSTKNWTINSSTAWSEGSWYSSADISNVIAGTVSRSGWVSNNDLSLIINSTSQTLGSDSSRQIRLYDYGAHYIPKFNATYVPAYSGSGIEGDPYIITDADQLQYVSNDVTAWYQLGNDIDASATSTWNSGAGFIPIANFTGNFDGNDHTITSLTISRANTDSQSLFSLIGDGGSVHDLTISATVRGYNNVGILASINNGSISNVSVSGHVYTVETGVCNVNSNMGGLVGYNRGVITGSDSSADITGSVEECTDYIGGLAGYNEIGGEISNSYATGPVSGYSTVGGFIGENDGSITTSYSSGAVTAVSAGSIGGFAGLNSGTITTSYSSSTVSGWYVVGGFVGWNSGGISNSYSTGNVDAAYGDQFGGFAGALDYNSGNGSITNSYTISQVQLNDGDGINRAGFVSNINTGDSGGASSSQKPTITNSYWLENNSLNDIAVYDGGSTPASEYDGVDVKSTALLKQHATFSGWDFPTTWTLDEIAGDQYPKLTWEGGTNTQYATVSGTVYTAEDKSTNIGADKTIGLSINGGEKATVETTAGGVFSFSNQSTISANNTITLFIDDETSLEANLVTQAVDASTDITGLELYTDKIVLTHQTAGQMTNTLLNTANNSADDDIFYTDGGSFNTSYELFIQSGKTYTPGGNVTCGDIDINGTFTPEANTINVAGSWDATGGTFTKGTSTINLNGESAATITTNDQDFYNLTIASVAATEDGLVAHWPMNEASGTTMVADLSGYNRNATSSSSTNVGTGVFGNARTFDGTQSASIPTSGLPYTNSSRTMCAWASTSSVSSSYSWAISYGQTAISGAYFIGRRYDDLYLGGYGNDVKINDIWITDQWKFICSTYNGTTVKAYVDGQPVGSPTAKTWSTNESAGYIGAQTNNTEKWTGSVDEARIFNRVLSDSEVAQLYSDNNLGFGSVTALSDIVTSNNLTVSSGTLDVSDDDLTVGNFIQSSGTFTAPGSSNSFTVNGGWDRSSSTGTFTHNSGTVVFAGDALIEGNTIFNNFSHTTGDKTITFAEGTTQTVAGDLTITGTQDHNIILTDETDNTTTWKINPATWNINYVTVNDSENLNETDITPANWTDGGDNIGWSDGALPPANVPGAPTVNLPASNSTTTALTIIIDQNSNSADTTYAIYNETLSQYVQANGSLGASAIWQDYTTWGGASGISSTGLSTNTQYTYKVKARNTDLVETELSSGTTKYTRAAINSAALSTYTSLAWNNFKVIINQSTNPASTEYQLIANGSYFQTDGTVGATATWATYDGWGGASGISVTDNTLTPATSYTLTFKVRNGDGITQTIGIQGFYTAPNVPLAPVLAATSASSITINIDNTTLSPANPADVTYAIACNDEATSWLAANGASCGGSPVWQTYTNWGGDSGKIRTGLSVNTQYTFRLKASGVAGIVGPSDTSSKYTLSNVPSAPSISTPTVDSLKIVINQNSNPAATRYAVYNATAGQYINSSTGALQESEDWQTYATWGGASGIVNTGLSPSTEYSYQVKADNGDGEETALSVAASETTTAAIPDAPSDVAIGSLSSTGFSVTWTDNSSTETGFEVYVSTAANADCSLATYPESPDYTAAANAVSQAVSGKSIDTQYCAKVLATADVGNSSAGYSSAAYTLANVPGAPTTTAYSSSELRVSININSNPSSVYYAIYNATAGQFVKHSDGSLQVSEDWQTYGDWSSQNFANTGLGVNTQYSYQVKAKNSADVETVLTEAVAKYTLANIPSITVSGDYSVSDLYHLDSTIGANLNPEGTNYWIQYSTDDSSYSNPNSMDWQTSTSYVFKKDSSNADLSANTQYWLKAKAKNGDGVETDYSVSNADVTPPAAPTSLEITNVCSTTALASWAESVGADSYNFSYGTDASASNIGETNNIVDTSKSLSGLSDQTQYFVKVSAISTTNGTGAYSSIENFTTATCLSPTAPSDFDGTAASSSQINWAWTDVSDNESGYYVRNTSNVNLSDDLGENASSWNETGLSPNTAYTRKAYVYNSIGGNNSNQSTVYTLAEAPSAPTVSVVSSSQLNIKVNLGNNPVTTRYAIYNVTTSQYVKNSDHTTQADPDWQLYADWGGASGFENWGLSVNTEYTYKVMARNGDDIDTTWSETASATTLAQYTVTISTSGNGSGNLSEETQAMDAGSSLEITATAAASSNFVSWADCDVVATNVCTISNIAENRNPVATFTLKTYTVTISTSGNGSGVLSEETQTVNYGDNLTATATPAISSNFTGWSGDATGTGDAELTNITSSKSITATFTLKTFTVTINQTGTGSGSFSGASSSINYGGDSEVTSIPSSDSYFVSWSGCDLTDDEVCTLEDITSNRTITAEFSLKPTISISINSGASKTNQATVNLSSTVNSAAAMIKVSNNSDLSGANWQTLSEVLSWELLDSESEGEKTVYAKVKDLNDYESSVVSDSVIFDTTAPGMAENVTAVSGNSSISLSWNNPIDSDFSKVAIFRSDDPDFVPTVSNESSNNKIWDSSSNTTQTYTDLTVENGKTYYYIIRSLDDADNYSGSSEIVSGKADSDNPTTPGIVAFSNIVITRDDINISNSKTIQFSWSASADENSGVKNYSVLIGTTSGGSEIGSTSSESNTLSYTFSSDGTYYIRVIAYDNIGNQSASSIESKLLIDTTAPSSVSNALIFDASDRANNLYAVMLSFDLSEDSVSGVKEYIVSRNGVDVLGNEEKTGTKVNINIPSGYASFLDILSAGANASYTIRSRDFSGNESGSVDATLAGTSSVKASGQKTGATEVLLAASIIGEGELAISNIKATPAEYVSEKTQAVISWETSVPATSSLKYGQAVDYAFKSQEGTGLNMGHTVVLADLIPNTTYHFQVTSKDKYGNEVSSADQTFTTKQKVRDQSVFELIVANISMSLNQIWGSIRNLFSSADIARAAGNAPTKLTVIDISSEQKPGYAIYWPVNRGIVSLMRSENGGNYSLVSEVAENYYIDFNVKDGNTYSYKIANEEAFVADAFSGTPSITDIRISEGMAVDDSASVIINFETDNLAKAQVSYGEDTSYGQTAEVIQSLNQSHTIIIEKLKPATNYHFKVKALDKQENNFDESEDIMFVTPKPAEDLSVLQIIIQALSSRFSDFRGWMSN